MEDNLLSFVSTADANPEFSDYPPEIVPGSIEDKLLKDITALVKKDGIRKDAIYVGETVASVTVNASENIYYDVAEFYNWYFEMDNERKAFMSSQKAATILSPIRAAVKPIVESGLKDLREAELIPADMDSDTLAETVTDDLTRYILNWQDWYYDRKEQEDYEDYWVGKNTYQEIYVNSDYGDFTNSTNYLDDDIDNPQGY
jgi:hypothetical protein